MQLTIDFTTEVTQLCLKDYRKHTIIHQFVYDVAGRQMNDLSELSGNCSAQTLLLEEDILL